MVVILLMVVIPNQGIGDKSYMVVILLMVVIPNQGIGDKSI